MKPGMKLIGRIKIIVLLLFGVTALNVAAQDRHDDLFLVPIIQDTLKAFIEKYDETFDNPYNAPTIVQVIVEQDSYNDTTVTFISSWTFIEEVSLDGETEPSLYIKGGCMQYGKTVVLYYSDFDDLPELVNENLLILERKDYDFFMSHDMIVIDITVRAVMLTYRYTNGKLELIRKIDTRRRSNAICALKDGAALYRDSRETDSKT